MAYEAIATAAQTLGLPLSVAAAETQAPINGTVPRFIDPIR